MIAAAAVKIDNDALIVPSLSLKPQLRELRQLERRGSTYTQDAMVHTYSPFMLKIADFLLEKECTAWRRFAHGVLAEGRFCLVEQAATRDFAKRQHLRLQWTDAAVAQSIYLRLESFLPDRVDGLAPAGCASNIRLYRYGPGHCFGKHIDESSEVGGEGGVRGVRGVSKFTVLIYLTTSLPSGSGGGSSSIDDDDSSACTGGETVFYNDHRGRAVFASVCPVRGTLLLHGHGERCLTHEGAPVGSGSKLVLRTDVLYC